MTNETLLTGMRFVFEKSSVVSKEQVDLVTTAFCNSLSQQASQIDPTSFKHLDPSLFREGGYAFLWEDILNLGDIVDALSDFDFPPNELGTMAWNLFLTWKRMRTVRVELTQEEFRVLRAIKAQKASVADVADYTGIPTDEVKEVLTALRGKSYKQTVPLVEGEDGQLTTRF